MHRHVVPSQHEFTRTERAVLLLPSYEQIRQRRVHGPVELRTASAQEHAQIDALGIVVQFPPVNSQAGRSGKRQWKAVGVEQVFKIVAGASLDGGAAPDAARK